MWDGAKPLCVIRPPAPGSSAQLGKKASPPFRHISVLYSTGGLTPTGNVESGGEVSGDTWGSSLGGPGKLGSWRAGMLGAGPSFASAALVGCCAAIQSLKLARDTHLQAATNLSGGMTAASESLVRENKMVSVPIYTAWFRTKAIVAARGAD